MQTSRFSLSAGGRAAVGLTGMALVLLLAALLLTKTAEPVPSRQDRFRLTAPHPPQTKAILPAPVKFSEQLAGSGKELKQLIPPVSESSQRDLPSLLRTFGSYAELPLAYRSAEVVIAEQWHYENGEDEILCVLDVGLGQEKVLLVGRSGNKSTRRYLAFFSAERLDALVDRAYWSSIKPALASAGFEVRENRYGAPLLNLRFLGDSSGFISAKMLVEQILDNKGDIFLSAPRSSSREEI